MKEKTTSTIEEKLRNNPSKISNTKESLIETLSVEVKIVDNKKRGATELPTSKRKDEVSNTKESMIETLSIEVKIVDNKKQGATELPTSKRKDEVGNVVEETEPIKIDVFAHGNEETIL